MNTHPATAVQIRALKKSYREAHGLRTVFAHLDLDIPAGQFLALLGRSGSGKSTLLNLLAGIDRADAGQICLGDQDLSRLDEAKRTRLRRRQVGFVFQFFNLIPTLTVAENTRLPLELNRLHDSSYRDWHQHLLERVGLVDRANSFPEQLSGGEQQRLALVRALVHRPQLLLADEPTGNLDETTGANILQLLKQFIQQSPTTVVMVTHSHEVATLADRRLYLHEGRLEPLA